MPRKSPEGWVVTEDEAAAAVQQHFKTPQQMQAYFSVLHQPSTDPDSLLRAMDPAKWQERCDFVAAFPRLSLLKDLAKAEGYRAWVADRVQATGRLELQLKAETLELWEAMKTIHRVVSTPPGKQMLITLTSLVPPDRAVGPEFVESIGRLAWAFLDSFEDEREAFIAAYHDSLA